MQSICIFGVFVADLCFYSKKIPIKGETVLGKDHLVGPGGKGSNQAIAAARLNGKVNFITKMGEDSHADMAFKIYKDSRRIWEIMMEKMKACEWRMSIGRGGTPGSYRKHWDPSRAPEHILALLNKTE